MIDGRLIRPIAIRHPGMFLSHPGMVTRPSYHWPRVTVSMESAMRSRDWSEKDIPLGAHRHAVRHADGVEAHPLHPGRLDAFLHLVGQAEQVHVAVVAFVPDARDPDLRLVQVRLGEPGGEELRLRGALGFRLGDARAPAVDRACHVSLRFRSVLRVDCSGSIRKTPDVAPIRGYVTPGGRWRMDRDGTPGPMRTNEKGAMYAREEGRRERDRTHGRAGRRFEHRTYV